MKSVVKYISMIWMLSIPVVASSHEGHGLIGEEHYHLPVDLDMLFGLILIGLLMLGLRHLLNTRK